MSEYTYKMEPLGLFRYFRGEKQSKAFVYEADLLARITELEAKVERLTARGIEDMQYRIAELEAEKLERYGPDDWKVLYEAQSLLLEAAKADNAKLREALITAWAEAFWRADVSNHCKHDARARAELKYETEIEAT